MLYLVTVQQQVYKKKYYADEYNNICQANTDEKETSLEYHWCQSEEDARRLIYDMRSTYLKEPEDEWTPIYNIYKCEPVDGGVFKGGTLEV